MAILKGHRGDGSARACNVMQWNASPDKAQRGTRCLFIGGSRRLVFRAVCIAFFFACVCVHGWVGGWESWVWV